MSCRGESGNKLAGLFSFAMDCGSGCFFTATAESSCRGPEPVLEREWEGSDGNTIHVFSLSFSFPPSFLIPSLPASQCLSLSLHSLSLSARGPPATLLIYYTPVLLFSFALSSCFLCSFFLSPYLISKFKLSFNSVFEGRAEEAGKKMERYETSGLE